MNIVRLAPLVVGVVAVAALTAACGGGSAEPGPASSGSAATYPVTVDVCGTPVTFDQAPTRAVSNDINPFADLVALGLTGSMVGTFGLDGFGPDGKTAVPTKYEKAYGAVKAVSGDYVELEPLVGTKADFLFAGYNYGLKVGTPMTPEKLETYGIKTYVLRESCAHVQPTKQAVTIDDTYTDLTNLGKIFGVPAKADAVVADLKQRIATVQSKVAGQTPKRVFVFDCCEDAPFTAPGLAMPDALITLAGGVNVFHDLKKSWTSVSWEQVVKADPQCILVNDYGTPTYAEKVDFLKSSPKTKDLTAVKDGCFIQSTYGELTPSPDNADAVEAIAKVLHPEQF